ncbi:primosomal protein N' [Natronorubrum tibetense]|uniref:Uncharacterized protein n=1 Tax=Natronorubrum tibetense GA33 TaxID=1114856 RepID=L9VSA4_9EURY|nr:hypothetical protein [Natronorubrum tibetense]ELY40070.1 hypothetical protein C496_12984 [Natronorubrum tibetense GA33]
MNVLERLSDTLSIGGGDVEYQCPSCGSVVDTACERCPNCGELDLRERGRFESGSE